MDPHLLGSIVAVRSEKLAWEKNGMDHASAVKNATRPLKSENILSMEENPTAPYRVTQLFLVLQDLEVEASIVIDTTSFLHEANL
ncbi:hypothetical protein G9C98_001260 [Cotesia typhae]|uniref:Uncharacterized protein n=1 Tax=Cotesia typhae TaxID=2053667 RepID=A0A8J5QXZ7_9HYME|nr:hypothetical protein G9C98_001260 [Cotesia typhae]